METKNNDQENLSKTNFEDWMQVSAGQIGAVFTTFFAVSIAGIALICGMSSPQNVISQLFLIFILLVFISIFILSLEGIVNSQKRISIEAFNAASKFYGKQDPAYDNNFAKVHKRLKRLSHSCYYLFYFSVLLFIGLFLSRMYL